MNAEENKGRPSLTYRPGKEYPGVRIKNYLRGEIHLFLMSLGVPMNYRVPAKYKLSSKR